MKHKPRKISKFLYWAPRVISLLFVLWLMLFSLDIFDLKLGFWGTLLGLFMHNIPAFIILALVIVAWKHEIVGAITFCFAGLLYFSMIIIEAIRGSGEWWMLAWTLPISGPAFLISWLFFLNWQKKSKNKK